MITEIINLSKKSLDVLEKEQAKSNVGVVAYGGGPQEESGAKKNLNQPDNDTCREKGKSLKNLGRHSSHFQKRKIKKLKYEFVMVLFYFSIVSMFVYGLILAYEWFNEPGSMNLVMPTNL